MDPIIRQKFIKIFNKFPCLWDKSSQDFLQFQKNSNYRNEIWSEVSKNFIEEGINVSEDLLRKTWNHMRNYFIRYKLPFTASKNLSAINHEQALHETLNTMSQTVLVSQVELKQEVMSQMEVDNYQEPQKALEYSHTVNVKEEPSTIPLDIKYVLSEPVPPPFIPWEYSPSAPIPTETASPSRKRSFPKEQSQFEPLYQNTQFPATFFVAKRDVEVQTEPDYLIRNPPCMKKLPSLNELLSLRITFSSKNTERKVELEKRSENTQYDQVYTERMKMDYQQPVSQFIFEDSYVLQSL